MPNWCHAKVSFNGDPQNINKLSKDIYEAMKFLKETHYNICNIGYFLSLSGFNINEYNNYYKDNQLMRRCFIYSDFPSVIFDYKDYAIIHAKLDSAWGTDYNILYLISAIYQVEFSAYSYELGLGLFDKCRNGNEDTYDYDKVLLLDCDAVNEEIEKHGNTELDYSIPVKSYEQYTEDLLNTLDEKEIEYTEQNISDCSKVGSGLHGIYYDINV